jgi:spermidine synthase
LKGPEILSKYNKGELVYYGDGIGGFTTVVKYVNPLGHIDYSMANSGKMDASSFGDMATQTLSANFPMLFHRSPRTVMVLGLASGITAGEVLYYPVEQLDVVDINKQVVKGSDFFLPWNNNVLSNPRTNMIIQDGRAHLQLTKRMYDVIISEPSNPWMAGLAALFTRDFFELAKNRLNNDGIFVQFMHSYQVDWATFALIGRTFAQVFPNSLLVRTAPAGAGFDYLFVGFNGKTGLSLENARQKLIYTQKSPNVAISDASLLYRLIVSEDLQNLFGQGFVDTDSRPRLEFAAPRLMYYNDPAITENINSRKQLRAETESIVQQVTADVNSQMDLAAYSLSVHSPFPESMVDMAKATPSQKERYFKLMETYYAENTMDYTSFRDNQLRQRCTAVQIATIEKNIDVLPDKPVSYAYLANLYYEKGMLDKAADTLFKSLKFKPDSAGTYYNLGLVFQSQGRLDDAAGYYRQALRLELNNAEIYYNLGITLKLQGKLDEAISCYRKALQAKPDYADAHNNLGNALMLQGRLNEAVDHFRRAVGLEPRNAEMHFNLGGALISQGRPGEAISHFRKALELKPDFAEAHSGLGVALANQNKADEAAGQFALALRDDPNHIIALTNLAGILATSPSQNIRDTKKAVVFAERAAELTDHKNAAVLNTLAAAYAASGRFDKAAVTAQKALELALLSGNETLTNHINEQLKLYRLKAGR